MAPETGPTRLRIRGSDLSFHFTEVYALGSVPAGFPGTAVDYRRMIALRVTSFELASVWDDRVAVQVRGCLALLRYLQSLVGDIPLLSDRTSRQFSAFRKLLINMIYEGLYPRIMGLRALMEKKGAEDKQILRRFFAQHEDMLHRE